MPELNNMSREDWEDADVDVGFILTLVIFDHSTFFLSTVGFVLVLRRCTGGETTAGLGKSGTSICGE